MHQGPSKPIDVVFVPPAAVDNQGPVWARAPEAEKKIGGRVSVENGEKPELLIEVFDYSAVPLAAQTLVALLHLEYLWLVDSRSQDFVQSDYPPNDVGVALGEVTQSCRSGRGVEHASVPPLLRRGSR